MKQYRILAAALLTALLLTASAPAFGAAKKAPGPLAQAVLTLDKTLTLEVGETYQLGYGLSPAIEGVAAKWKTSSSKYFTVTKSGLLRAKKAGSAKVTLTLTLKGYSASCKAVCLVKVVRAGSREPIVVPETDPAPIKKTPPAIPDPAANYDSRALAVIDLVNRERTAIGLGPLALEDALMQSAAARAKEIDTLFSHTRPDGSSWSSLVPYKTKGENIGYYTGAGSAEYIMSLWMRSSTHRDNILKSEYTHIGVGVYQKGDATYWVQHFARP